MVLNKKAIWGAAILGALHYAAHSYLPAPWNMPLYVTGVVVVGYYLLVDMTEFK